MSDMMDAWSPRMSQNLFKTMKTLVFKPQLPIVHLEAVLHMGQSLCPLACELCQRHQNESHHFECVQLERHELNPAFSCYSEYLKGRRWKRSTVCLKKRYLWRRLLESFRVFAQREGRRIAHMLAFVSLL